MKVRHAIAGAFREWLSIKAAALRYGSRRWTVLCMHETGDPKRIETLLESVQDQYRIVSLSEGLNAIRSPAVSGSLLTFTFDDGDKTVWEHCLPQLRSRSVPACLFVCTGWVEAGFRDVSTGRYPVMSWDNLKEWVDAGLEVGAHTVNHIPLNQATFDRAKWEILESKNILEEHLGCKVPHFAYPWGYYTDQLDDWLQKDQAFTTICTTIPRDNYPTDVDKRIYRKPGPAAPDGLNKGLRNPTLYETIRWTHQRSILNGLAPVVWRMGSEE